MLNVHQLNVFVIAADTLNFTQTAKRLHLTQSSVSQHIKSLENQLGADLFVRKGRSLEVTDAGAVLLPMAREIVEGSIRATEQMELLKKEIHGHLIVGCNTAPGKYMLPTILARFHEQYPLVKMTCQVLPQPQTIKGLAEGEIQFAITNVYDDDQQAGEFQLFLEEPILLIVPHDHPWAERDEIEPEELYGEQFIMREKSSGTYINVNRSLTAAGVDIEKLDILIEMGNSEAIALAVEQGLGASFISKMILDMICPGRVKVVPIRGVEIKQKLYFGHQDTYPSTGAQVAFWDFIRKSELSFFRLEKIGTIKAIEDLTEATVEFG